MFTADWTQAGPAEACCYEADGGADAADSNKTIPAAEGPAGGHPGHSAPGDTAQHQTGTAISAFPLTEVVTDFAFTTLI